MPVKLIVRTLTVLLVLLIALLGVELYRLARGPDAPVASDGPPGIAVGKFSPLDAPQPAPEITLLDQSGKTVALDTLRGRVVLINFWATWCAPCIREMPSLDRLQAKFDGLAILAVSEDRGGKAVVDPFLATLAVPKLAIYLDPKSAVGHAFGIEGLPTSVLIGRDGRILGTMLGGAEWDSPEMVKLIARYLG